MAVVVFVLLKMVKSACRREGERKQSHCARVEGMSKGILSWCKAARLIILLQAA